MLSPDAKKLWNSPAGSSLMAALLGSKTMDDADKATAKKLLDGTQEPPLEPEDDKA